MISGASRDPNAGRRRRAAGGGGPLHPIQLYELLAYLLVFVVVQRVARSTARPGTTLLTYAMLYGAARLGLEFFRGDPPMIAGLIVPQVASAVLVAAGVALRLRRTGWRGHETVTG